MPHNRHHVPSLEIGTVPEFIIVWERLKSPWCFLMFLDVSWICRLGRWVAQENWEDGFTIPEDGYPDIQRFIELVKRRWGRWLARGMYFFTEKITEAMMGSRSSHFPVDHKFGFCVFSIYLLSSFRIFCRHHRPQFPTSWSSLVSQEVIVSK